MLVWKLNLTLDYRSNGITTARGVSCATSTPLDSLLKINENMEHKMEVSLMMELLIMRYLG